MGSQRPKQYLEIRGKLVLEYTLERLLAAERLSGIVVALGQEDSYWAALPCSLHPRIRTTAGGKERADSVYAALLELSTEVASDDWVLVHDAARPCITVTDIDKLIDQLQDHPVGGILALPSSDTLKWVGNDGEVVETMARDHIWRALTPQMFRVAALREALENARRRGLNVTDEASALELQGLKPRIVEGRPDNIKITRPEDLPLAAFYLEQQCYE
jgi:2-C-methyl-D-erythritol 4-phosphate cytidylyltransferase